jgi:hypothetical protein
MHLTGVVVERRHDVMKGDQPIRCDKRRIEVEVVLHPFVGVISVDPQEVDRATVEDLHQLFQRRWRV